MKPRDVWRYWVSRDSINGELSGTCNLWSIKPVRVRHRYRVTWVCADHKTPGHLGEYSLRDVVSWFRVLPSTDLELIKVEQWAPST